jgi:hypothetical protein
MVQTFGGTQERVLLLILVADVLPYGSAGHCWTILSGTYKSTWVVRIAVELEKVDV